MTRRRNAPVSYGRKIRGGSSAWLSPQASVILGYDFFSEVPLTPTSILKRWNGSSWESVVFRHGPGWPEVSLNTTP